MNDLKKQDLLAKELEKLKAAMGEAFKSLELAYPNFSLTPQMMTYWTQGVLHIDKILPLDIKNGVEYLITSGTKGYDLDLGKLVKAVRKVRSERINIEHKEFKKLEADNRKTDIVTGLKGDSEYAKASIAAVKKLRADKGPNALDEYKQTCKELKEKYKA